MKTIKITGLVFCMFFGLNTAKMMGQEIEFSILGGLTAMKQPSTKLTEGNTLGVSAIYKHPIKENLSLGIGIELGQYSLTKELTNFKGTNSAIDRQGDAFEFRYNLVKFSEDLKGNYFAIPIKIEYIGPTLGSEKLRLYASAGIKYQVYSKVKTNQSFDGINTSGYYERWDAELHGPTFEGFGNLGNRQEKNKLKLDNGFFVVGEVGVKYILPTSQAIYFGIYGDCDLGSSGQSNQGVLSYNNQEQMNSVLNGENQRYKMRMFSLGMKVKYSFGL